MESRSRLINADMIKGFVCGVNGGIATVYIGQPLDTIKVKMQMYPKLYKNALNCFIDTFKKDGIYRGLYAGTLPALAANVAENSVLFCVLAPCKRLISGIMDKPVENLNPFQHALAGSCAGIFTALVLCPTELVKCKQQAMRELIEARDRTFKLTDNGPWIICKNVYQAEGFRGFYHGFAPTLVREVPGFFSFFGSYELSQLCFMKYGAKQRRKKEDLTVFEIGVSGAIAGICIWMAIFPLDVVKSRIQIGSGTGLARISFPSMMVKIVRTEGFRCLYKGLGPTVLRTIPATAVLFIVVEYTQRMINHLF